MQNEKRITDAMNNKPKPLAHGWQYERFGAHY
jgi:hypothetical protein